MPTWADLRKAAEEAPPPRSAEDVQRAAQIADAEMGGAAECPSCRRFVRRACGCGPEQEVGVRAQRDRIPARTPTPREQREIDEYRRLTLV